MPTGYATIDFGAAPGSSTTTTLVTGSWVSVAGSYIEAYIQGDSTLDHNVTEQEFLPITLRCGDFVTGSSFTIYATSTLRLTGTFLVRWVAANNPSTATWSIDATSKTSLPASATEWSNFISAFKLDIATPSSLWLFQETSGSFADSIGSRTLTPTSIIYSNAISGWSATAMGTSSSAVSNAATTSINPVTATVVLGLWVLPTPTSVTQRNFFELGTTGSPSISAGFVLSGSIESLIFNVNLSGTSGGGNEIQVFNTVVPFIVTSGTDTGLVNLLFNYPNVFTQFFNPSDISGNSLLFGSAHGVSGQPAAYVLYGCAWTGTNAEISFATLFELTAALMLPQIIDNPYCGTAVIDFGTAPGTSTTTIVVTNGVVQTGSYIDVFMQGDSTSGHTAYEHLVTPMTFRCGDIIANTSFTIYASSDLRLTGTFIVRWTMVP